MASSAASADTPLAADASRVIADALAPPDDPPGSIDPAIRLFNADYDRADGRLLSVDPKSPGRPSKTARTVSGRATTRSSNKAIVGSPTRKPRSSGLHPPSPARLRLRRAAGIIVDAVSSARRTESSLTPSVVPVDASLVTPLDAAFTDDLPPHDPPTTTKRRNTGSAMIGLVPKSGFLVNQRQLYEGKGKVDDAAVARAIKARREAVLWHFSRVGKTKTKQSLDERNGPVTRSSLSDAVDWSVDLDAVDCAVTEQRRLSRYAFEHLVTLPANTVMVLFVRNHEANSRLTKALTVETLVGKDRTTISGREYIRLKVALNDVRDNNLLTGKSVVGGAYSNERFMNDFKHGRCGFSVSFVGTDETTSFTWKEVIALPTEFMFFGAPLNVTRSFDEAMKSIKSLDTLHHRFVAFFDHFEGDVESCLALINSYLARRGEILTSKAAAAERKS